MSELQARGGEGNCNDLTWVHLSLLPKLRIHKTQFIYKQALPFCTDHAVPSEQLYPTPKYDVTSLVVFSPLCHMVKLKLHLDQRTENQTYFQNYSAKWGV